MNDSSECEHGVPLGDGCWPCEMDIETVAAAARAARDWSKPIEVGETKGWTRKMATEAAYARIRHSFWTDPDIKRQLSPEQKELLLYYFSSPHSNMIGLFNCPFAYVADETGLHPADVQAWTLGPLAPFVTYDPRTEEILVHRSARHNIDEEIKPGDKRITKVRRLLGEAHSKYLVRRFLELYASWPLEVEKPNADPPPDKLPNTIAPNDLPSPLQGPTNGAPHGAYDAAYDASAVQCSAVQGRKDTEAKASGKPSRSSFPQNVDNSAASGDADISDGDLMSLIRKRFYAPDARPPTGYDEGREFSCFKLLRKRGKTGRDIARAIEGAAAIRDDGGLVKVVPGEGAMRVDWLNRGDKLTMRALVNAKSGVTDLWQLAMVKMAEADKAAGKGKTAWEAGAVKIQIVGAG